MTGDWYFIPSPDGSRLYRDNKHPHERQFLCKNLYSNPAIENFGIRLLKREMLPSGASGTVVGNCRNRAIISLDKELPGVEASLLALRHSFRVISPLEQLAAEGE